MSSERGDLLQSDSATGTLMSQTQATIWDQPRRLIQGEILTVDSMRGAYATDASVYQEFPRAVALPKSAEDVELLIEFCRREGVCVIGRGGGTSLSGQAIGPGLVIDYSRYLNRVLSLDPERQLAVVQPGAVLDELNHELRSAGLHFAPDPATGSRATIGGMIGNNSCGTRSICYGRTSDAIESLNGLLADGTRFTTRWLGPDDWRAEAEGSGRMAEIYKGLSRLVEDHRDLILERVPRLPRIVAGYSLQSFVNSTRPRSLSDLVCGSEGTLALVNEATLRLRPVPRETCLVISAFQSVDDSLVCLPEILECGPSAVELLDDVLVQEAVRNASTRDLARVIVPGQRIPAAVQLVEFIGDEAGAALAKAERYLERMRRSAVQVEQRLLTNSGEQRQAWEVRRLGLGLISNIPGKAKAIALIEDACLPVEQLPAYNRHVYAVGKRLGMKVSTYAHASVGVLHYKIMLDLHTAGDRQKMREMAEDCFAKCCELGGVFSGEHGDGIVRGEFLPRQFGPEIYQAFVEVKRLFDPSHLLNPGRKIDSPPLDSSLRFGDGDPGREAYLRATEKVSSWYRYGEQGDLVGAIEQCNGVGACRQNLKGTMCPSYRATRDERDSTRGRANLLRLAISGQLQPPGLANSELHQALELCLACKACKSECPNAVDMARLKSEALQVRWQKEGVSRAAAFVGRMPQRIASFHRLASVAKLAARVWPVRQLLERWYGVDRRRPLPLPAAHSFDAWFAARKSTCNGRPVALFVDTWNRYTEPEIGIAAVELLESCGFAVEVPSACDALRTRLSVGLLEEARERGASLFQELAVWVERGVPIVCLEPSEASALCDDLPDLIADSQLGQRVAGGIHLLDDFLAAELAKGAFRLKPKSALAGGSVTVHPHCHQRALFRAGATVELLTAAGFQAQLADWGCCGMAGSFGYSHYEVSRKVAEQRFLPGIKGTLAAGGTVVATGTSCRQQAADFAGAHLRHWVQLLTGEVGGQPSATP
ncbi:MAG: FAD-binding and (Fe-S)-binding domain-containing protein [Planctomycetota bacterium]